MSAPQLPPIEDDIITFEFEEAPSCAYDLPLPYEYIVDDLFVKTRKPRKSPCVYCFLFCVFNFAMCVVLYNYFAPYQQSSEVQILCDIPYPNISSVPKGALCRICHDEEPEESAWYYRFEVSSTPSDPNYISHLLSDEYLEEEINIDIRNGTNTALVDVYDFRGGRSGTIVHDFKVRLSAIVDGAGNRCYVTPLDESLLMPPKEFIDLVQKCNSKLTFCNMSTEVIVCNMNAILLPHKDLIVLSDYITAECHDRNIYMLEFDGFHPMNRAVKQIPEFVKFVEFLGKGVVAYNVLNMADIEEIEKDPNSQTFAKNLTDEWDNL